MCILVVFLMSNMFNIPGESRSIRKTKGSVDNESFGFHQYDNITGDVNPKPYRIFDEFGDKREDTETNPDVDSNMLINNDPTNHEITLTPPWSGYDTIIHENKWGISDCWAEDTQINGDYGRTTLHAWAGPGAGWAGVDMNIMFYDVFVPPKDSNYSFTYDFYQEGRIKLESMTIIIGCSAARGGATLYFYLWDGETVSFEKSMTVEDHASVGGVGNGEWPYYITKSYSNSAHLKKDKKCIFGANGIPWVVCDGFLECFALADNYATKATLKKMTIKWPNSPPNTPRVISPSDGATDVSTSPVLKWSCDDPDGKYDTLTYDVYFGKDSSPPLVASDQTSTSYKPGSLKDETTYYWKIVARDSKGSTKSSPIWSFTTEKEGCCFPAGTLITMADGSYKNIEDIRIGDKVLSYDTVKGRFTTWRVKMLGKPVHPVISINHGLVRVTVDHPFFVKKTTGEVGWAAFDVERAEKVVTFNGDLLRMEIGDKLFTSDGKWIEITSIEDNSTPVQTYNILSFSGTKTYFANNILVYEEHPPSRIMKFILKLFDKHHI